MNRLGNWFFDGYKGIMEPKKNGTGMRRVLVYTGEWYGLKKPPETIRRIKLSCLLLSIGMAALYFYINLTPAGGGMWRWVAAPCTLALVPMMFYVIGLANFLLSRETWEKRVFCAGYRRMGRSAMGILGFMAATSAAELIYIVLHLPELAAELHYLIGALLCVGCMAAILMIQKRNPAVVVKGPKIE